MTGKERTLRALNFEAADRAPMAGGLVGNAEFLAEVAGVPDFWAEPRRTAFEAFRRLGCDAVLGPVIPKRPETTTRDSQGRATIFTKHVHSPKFTTPEQIAEHVQTLPSPEELRAQFNAQAAYDEYVQLMKAGNQDAGDMLFIPHCLGYAPAFPAASTSLYDYEAFLMACALQTAAMKRLFQFWGEQSRLRLEAVARATVEHDLLRLLWIGQDLCDRNGPVLSPQLLEELYFPFLARAIEPLKVAKMKVIWHADANYRRIVPRMIELGIDGFQGLYEEKGGMQLEELARMKAVTGLPLLFFGSISTVKVLPSGTEEDVRREVDRCIRAVGDRSGLLLAPSSSIGPEVPKENIRAMFERARLRKSEPGS